MKLFLFLAAVGVLRAAPAATLLEITRAAKAAVPFNECVVLVIDAQREYVDGRLRLEGIADALRETNRLLQRARSAGVPIIHIRQISTRGRGVFEEGGPFIAFAPEAEPKPGEIVITKMLPNAFAGTELADVLKKIRRNHVVVSGYMTHMCVSATARAALDLGFATTIIADACATRDLPDGVGGAIAAQTVHRVALAELADRFSTVVPTLDAIP